MTDKVYKELYDTREAFQTSQNSLQAIYSELFPFVAAEGEQLSLQDVITRTVQILQARTEPKCEEKLVDAAE
ncbi:hypothetical protein Arno18_74 [Pectobacterium phage Arno18]|uniref:Uncharacterized protein n=1 Tax=Pectobacterium phage Arno18 TaxID=2500578 RepID=A0A678ZSP6_9CAUD|nr:hypothetical protein Arno18_74 [Pectobacterium phage Arno18]